MTIRKYSVGGSVHASTYIGEFAASSPEEAIEKAHEQAHVSVCHQFNIGGFACPHCGAKADEKCRSQCWYPALEAAIDDGREALRLAKETP